MPGAVTFPSLPQGVTMASLARRLSPPALPHNITVPSLPSLPSMPRGLLLRRTATMPNVSNAAWRMLRECFGVLDHQTSSGLCGCCWALRPRFKRLVDNIFPEDPEDGLVQANMEKLTFFALSAPEKLDRIAAYLSERLTRELNRHRYGYVCIAMEAMEQLLLACHCQSINLLVESFLSTLRLLLEADKPHLHILATNSFVKFANIEEDTPSYHRSYDFFVSRFSQMCHSKHEDIDVQNRTRVSGIKGLQGVVRKTVDDELQVNIWEPCHMEQIVPALLVNLEQHTHAESGSPAEQTEVCFRELFSRAAYGHINNAIRPVLMHLDVHNLWEGRTFAVRCFQIIMFSIQSQHSHLVIQQLLGHLDANSRSAASVRAGIVEVLSEAAIIEATGSVGPTVLEVFNTLLRQLRQSVDYQLTGYHDSAGQLRTSSEGEELVQEVVIRTIGECIVLFVRAWFHQNYCSCLLLGSFANMLPVYQRSEVMLFIMGKIPVPGIYPALGSPTTGFEGSRMIQVMLLKSLLQVSQRYENSNLLVALPSSFLQPLLSFTLMEDPEIRLLVLFILTSLIDRHHNRHTLSFSVGLTASSLKMKEDHSSRQDVLFMRKELALSKQEGFSTLNRCGVHALCAAFFRLLAQLGPPPPFQHYIRQVIDTRKGNSPYLLPDVFSDSTKIPEEELKVDEACMFVQTQICEALAGSSYHTHVERFNILYTPQLTDDERLTKRKSVGDIVSLQLDPEISPQLPRKPQMEQITFETLKNAIDNRESEEEEERKRRKLVEKFQTAPFEEIAAECGARASLLQSKLDHVFELIICPPPSPSGTMLSRSTPLHEMKFPDLCVY
ncbi:protein EFR3 homolog B-like isoform 4-T5 [Synchiropus picturatus]